MISLFLTNTQLLASGLESCGLLWCFHHLFGFSFWQQPFTSEDPLVSNKLNYIHFGWIHFQQCFIFGWSVSLRNNTAMQNYLDTPTYPAIMQKVIGCISPKICGATYFEDLQEAEPCSSTFDILFSIDYALFPVRHYCMKIVIQKTKTKEQHISEGFIPEVSFHSRAFRTVIGLVAF